VGNAFERLLVPPMVVTPGGSPAWCSFEIAGKGVAEQNARLGQYPAMQRRYAASQASRG